MRITRSIFLFLCDLIIILVSYYFSFIVRFEGKLDPLNLYIFSSTAASALLIYILSFLAFGIYNRLWRYLSLSDVAVQLMSILFGTVIFLLISPLLLKVYSFPRSVILINAVFLSLAALVVRFSYRFIREEIMQIFHDNQRQVLILGAGDAGALLLQDIKKAAGDKYRVVAFLDDDQKKLGKRIYGVKVISTIENLPRIVKKKRIAEIFIAIPSATREELERIFEITGEAGVNTRIIPATREILDSEAVFAAQLKPIDLKDLLDRDPAAIDRDIIRKNICGKKILVTGAGGSIGYELCRQILDYGPRRLMLLELDETRLFNALNRLNERGRDIIDSVMVDIRKQDELERVLLDFRPEIVFHAAAYKHVGLGELNPASYIENNIFGTVNLVSACERLGVKKFIFISSDKAVEPANIMGATKRISEEFIRAFAGGSKTSFLIVRFGNVLGSSGSVIEIFEEQIKSGRTITITAKEAKRFFMTIEEAITLSLETASIGNNAEVYILDMGEPIKVTDLVQHLWFLSKKVNLPQANIVYTGLREGDKLEEKIFEDAEEPIKTHYDKLLLIKNKREPIEYEKFSEWLSRLKDVVDNADTADKEALARMFREIIPNYKTFAEYKKSIEEVKS